MDTCNVQVYNFIQSVTVGRAIITIVGDSKSNRSLHTRKNNSMLNCIMHKIGDPEAAMIETTAWVE